MHSFPIKDFSSCIYLIYSNGFGRHFNIIKLKFIFTCFREIIKFDKILKNWSQRCKFFHAYYNETVQEKMVYLDQFFFFV